MNGLQLKAEGTVVHAAVPNDWHIEDVDDFNGDGNSDILWAGLPLGDEWPGDQSRRRRRPRSGP
jgi:hypothetical protein